MKFIASNFDPETGISTVTLQHLGEKFNGSAKCHPNEMDKISEFTGCTYAEIRATINALKYERKLAKNKADMALDFVKACECYAKFNKEDPAAKSMYRQLNQRIKRVNDLTDEINNLLSELKFAPVRRQRVLEKWNNKKSKEDNS